MKLGERLNTEILAATGLIRTEMDRFKEAIESVLTNAPTLNEDIKAYWDYFKMLLGLYKD